MVFNLIHKFLVIFSPGIHDNIHTHIQGVSLASNFVLGSSCCCVQWVPPHLRSVQRFAFTIKKIFQRDAGILTSKHSNQPMVWREGR